MRVFNRVTNGICERVASVNVVSRLRELLCDLFPGPISHILFFEVCFGYNRIGLTVSLVERPGLLLALGGAVTLEGAPSTLHFCEFVTVSADPRDTPDRTVKKLKKNRNKKAQSLGILVDVG
jgi:hypothetical protein